MKKLLLASPLLFLALATVAYAGSLRPSASPAATSYTLTDIYTRLTTNETATAGDHDFAPSGAPDASFKTLTQIYDAIPTITATKVFTGSTFLGVTGNLVLACATETFDATANKVANAYDDNGNGSNRWCMKDTGDATEGDILASKKAWVDGREVTGSMTNVGAQTITPTTSDTAITAGYHNGAGSCVGDANLVVGNIKNAVSIFGVTGTYSAAPTVPATGQTTANYGTSRTCADGGTGTCEDGYYHTGTALSYANVEVNGQYVAVNDAATGLMWQKCPAGLSDTNKANTCTAGSAVTLVWKTAGNVTEAINYCENLRLCNDGTYQGDKTTEGDCTDHSGDVYVNWRLPNVKELFSLTIQEAGAITGVKVAGTPFINQTFFPATASSNYWSSTTRPVNTIYAFYVNFLTSDASISAKTAAANVRCVRGQ
ncbi:MAG: DUF1566 domain-containing protein [Candidatus Peregrinibacteria bacterium]